MAFAVKNVSRTVRPARVLVFRKFHTESVGFSQNVVKPVTPDIDIPDILLPEYVWRNVDRWGTKTALVCAETGRSYTYHELYKHVQNLSKYLSTVLPPRSTVAIISRNVPEYPIIFFSIIQAGCTVTTFNPTYTEGEIRKQLLDSETKFIFTLNELYPTVKKAVDGIPNNVNIPIVIIKHQQNETTPSGTIKLDELLTQKLDGKLHPEFTTDEVVVLPYSSGTTGVSKGVQLTNRNIVSNLHQFNADGMRFVSEAYGSFQEVVPAILPFYHIYGMNTIMVSLLSQGAKLVTVPKFGSDIFLKVLNEYKPTCAYLVPPIILFLLNNEHVHPENILQMKTIISGAAPLGAMDITRMHDKTGGKVNLIQAYGLTETSPVTHTQTASLANGIKIGGIGFLVPNTEAKIVKPDDLSNAGLGPNESGEILIRGPQVMKGYFKNQKASKEMLSSDGWLRTGDVGHYDEDRHFYITDRIKDLIKVKGLQVPPAELEELLRDHPNIKDAAVVGIPHEAFGEVPKAFVVPKDRAAFKEEDVKAYVARKVARHKQLVGGVVTVNEIPKNPSGKILRRQLRD